MALFNACPSGNPGAGRTAATARSWSQGAPRAAVRLLNRDEVPSWYGYNPYIHTSYPPTYTICFSMLEQSIVSSQRNGQCLLTSHQHTTPFSAIMPSSPTFGDGLTMLPLFFQIPGSFITGTYIDFYCEPQLQKIYWAIVYTSLGLFSPLVLSSFYPLSRFAPLDP
jgi:hypothetical protein